METVTHELPGSAGETVKVDDFGGPDGFPVLVHAGSPGSRRIFRPDAKYAAREFGLRLLSYDRPGYNGRPRRKGRTIADAAADVRAIADALGIGRLGVWGFSGGGSYALMCAALLPGLVTGAAVFAGFAPYGSPGLDFAEGWPEPYRREVELFFTEPDRARAHWRQDAEDFYPQLSTADGWMRRWGALAGVDEAHSWELAEHLAAEQRDCLSDGAGGVSDDGWWDDWAAVLSPWGCDLGAVQVPVRIWHGARDRAVPVAHGRWLAAHVPGALASIGEDEDHTDVEHKHRAEACAWLRELALHG